MNYVFIFLFTFIKWLLFSYNLLLFICDVYMYIPLFKFNSYTPNRFPDKKRKKKPYNFNSFLLTNLFFRKKKIIKPTTFNGGSLGSCIDEERCELRYVMRIAQLSESLKFWTHIAPWQQCHGMPGRVSFPNQFKSFISLLRNKRNWESEFFCFQNKFLHCLLKLKTYSL